MKKLIIIAIALIVSLLAFPAYADNPDTNEKPEHKLAGPPTLEQLRNSLSNPMPLGELNPLSPNYKKYPVPERNPQGTRTPDQYFGVIINEVSGSPTNPGAYGVHRVQFDMETPEDPDENTHQPLYAPTLMPPNNSRFEATFYYWQPYEYGSTLRKFGVWDHAIGDWADTWDLIDDIKDDYTIGGLSEVTVQYVNSEWRVWLYDYSESEWVQFWHASGSSGYDDGWDWWEAKHDNYVSDYDSIEASSIQVWGNNDWHTVTDAYGDPEDRDMHASWTKTWHVNYYHWEVEP